MQRNIAQFSIVAWAIVSVPSLAAQELRYDIQPKQVVSYDVTITVSTLASTETMSGMIVYTGVQVQDDKLTLRYKGGLRKTTRSTVTSDGARSRFGGGPPAFLSPMPFEEPEYRGLVESTNTLVISSVGKVQQLRGDSQLPYLLGNLSTLPFEALPTAATNEWSAEEGIAITSGGGAKLPAGVPPGFGIHFGPRSSPRFGSFARNNGEKTRSAGGENATYKIRSDDGTLVTISKTYSMAAPAATSTASALAMKGTGVFVFNRAEGLPESMELEIDFLITKNRSELKVPISIVWKRKSDEDLSTQQKSAEEQQAAMKRPTPPADLKALIEQLVSPDDNVVLKKLKNLQLSSRREIFKEDVEFVVQVGLLLTHENEKIRKEANVLWKRWGTVVQKHASDEDKKRVAASVEQHAAEMSVNPFVELDSEDGKGFRTWSDKTGRFEFEGEFQEVEFGVVLLESKEGENIRVPLSRLSEPDQKLVEQLLKD